MATFSVFSGVSKCITCVSRVSFCVGHCVCGLPSARLCAVQEENNTRHVCEQSIPAGLKRPSPIRDHLNNHPA